ncbi:hypothetical protein [Streptomyces sp. NBC_01334]|uniref:hypothetical protein n=1 Tax=Streptomyces sp. NBC_01334 TaxID=2903827 RepID=UPI002E0DFF5E|nr:hypothetical protein OG736_43735 [Streptomyces sp. NBC_01334]
MSLGGFDDLYTHLEPFTHASAGNGPADEHQANIVQALREHRPTTGQTPPSDSGTTT